MNFAAVQKAPLVVVLENNQWAYSTPVSQPGAAARSGRPRARLRHSQHGSWTAMTLSPCCAQCGKPSRMARGPRPVLDRSQNHAHGGTCAARCRRLCAAATCWPIGRRAIRSPVRKVSDRASMLDASCQGGDRCARIEREMAEDLAFAENSPFPAAGTADAGRVLRGLPCHRSRNGNGP